MHSLVLLLTLPLLSLQFTLEDSRASGGETRTTSSAYSRQDRLSTQSPERRISRPFSSTYTSTLQPPPGKFPWFSFLKWFLWETETHTGFDFRYDWIELISSYFLYYWSPSRIVRQGKLFQKCTHLLYCSVLSRGGNVNTRRIVKAWHGNHLSHKKSMKYSGHRKL